MSLKNIQPNPEFNKDKPIIPRLKKKINSSNAINVVVTANDILQVEKAVSQICEVLDGALIPFSGPVPLTRKKKRWDIRTSPHVNKDAMQVFEEYKYRRLIRVPRSRETITALGGIDNIYPAIVKIKGIEGGI